MSARLRHVFFDAVGTLFVLSRSIGAVYHDVALRHGFPASPDQLDQLFAKTIRDEPLAVRPLSMPACRDHERLWWRNIVQRTFAPLGEFPRFDAFFDEVFELFRTARVWQLTPQSKETLRTLRQLGYELGIISDMDSRLYDILRGLEIDAFFTQVSLAFEAGYAKPDPRLFAHALRGAGVVAAAAAHVGNHATKDIEAATRVGMRAILYDPERHESSGACVHRLACLPERLIEFERQRD